MLIVVLLIIASGGCFFLARYRRARLGERPENSLGKKGMEYQRRLQSEVLPLQLGFYGCLGGVATMVILLGMGIVPLG